MGPSRRLNNLGSRNTATAVGGDAHVLVRVIHGIPLNTFPNPTRPCTVRRSL